jgi:predicted nucleotidyltransferase
VNPCSIGNVAPCYQPIIRDAIAVYTGTLGKALRDVRLMGSVPRGDAVQPHSDIDFIALLAEDASAEQAEQVADAARRLTADYACVSKVDLEVVALGQLSEARRFILASDSLHLWGQDLFTIPEQHISGRKLADMLTPNLASILARYQTTVRELREDDETALLQWSRWSGKDVLKCLRKHALLAGGSYERTIGGIRNQLLTYLPEHRDLIDALFELYAHPIPDRARILAALAQADRELPKQCG